MRFVQLSLVACAASLASNAFASEGASLSLTLNAAKFGSSKLSIKPVDGETTSLSSTYMDIVGLDAENDSPAVFELGFKYNKNVFYFNPIGTLGEREFWAGLELSDGLEAGIMTAGYYKSLSPAVQIDGGKMKSESMSKLGFFGIYAFNMFEQNFELTAVPFVKMGETKYEQSTSDKKSLGFGVSTELMYMREATKNLTFGTGVSFDWEQNKNEINGKETSTETQTDLGLHLGRVAFSF
jgi:hypothetical protein